MKVIIFTNTFRHINTFHRAMLQYFINKKCETIIVASNEKFFDNYFTPAGVSKIVDFKLSRRYYNIINHVFNIVKFSAIVKKEKPDLVVSLTIKPNLVALVSRLFLKYPLAAVVTGFGSLFISKPFSWHLIESMYRVLLHLIGYKKVAMCFQNKEDRDYFVSKSIVSQRNTVVFPGSGIIAGDSDGNAENSCTALEKFNYITFLYLGRFLWHKGMKELIDAGKILYQKRKDFKIVIGGGIESKNISSVNFKTLNEWQNNPWLEYIGYVANSISIIKKYDICVLLSYREGFPRFLLEAAYCSKPIITTMAAGCSELVLDGHNGYLVPVRDSLKTADAMLRMMDLGPEGRANLGKAGREYAETNFSLGKLYSEYERVFSNILA